jgi:hypothetical protein
VIISLYLSVVILYLRILLLGYLLVKSVNIFFSWLRGRFNLLLCRFYWVSLELIIPFCHFYVTYLRRSVVRVVVKVTLAHLRVDFLFFIGCFRIVIFIVPLWFLSFFYVIFLLCFINSLPWWWLRIHFVQRYRRGSWRQLDRVVLVVLMPRSQERYRWRYLRLIVKKEWLLMRKYLRIYCISRK